MTEQEERWTIYPCDCGAVGGNPSFERAIPCGRRSDGFHDAKAVKVVPASRVQELEGELAEAEELFKRMEKVAGESLGLLQAAESRLARLEEAGNGLAELWREIAPGFLPDRYNDLVDERTEAWNRSLTHSTPPRSDG